MTKKTAATNKIKDSLARKRKEANDAAAAYTASHMHDPDVAPHLFKKWVGDRVSVVRVRQCDHPTCAERGDYRAPKSRDQLEEYFWFCLEHVRDYNAAWNYYEGMSVAEIEEAVRAATTWERPTWPLGNQAERKVRAAFKRTFGDENFEDNAEHIHAKAQERGVDPRYLAQLNALRELGLAPPVNFESIKKRYRDLVKAYHPDMHGGEESMEEKIKRLNSAFTILKEFYAVEEIAESYD